MCVKDLSKEFNKKPLALPGENFFCDKEFFCMNIDFKNGCKNEFKDNKLLLITKRFAADPEIGFLTKSISKANGYAIAMPPALELKDLLT